MPVSENEILEQLDLAFNGELNSYYPVGRLQDIKYNFFPDLEHGYCVTAGNRFHLYADLERWAIVFEKSGYFNRASAAEIELDYFGNCVDYPIQKYLETNYISNSSQVYLIDAIEFQRIENKEGTEMEQYELISFDTKEINVRNKLIPFNNNYKDYESVGIKIREYENSKNLIAFGDVLRFLHETNPSVISATEEEIRMHIPNDIPKLMTIDDFHFVSAYDKLNLPSTQETYQLMAKVLTSKDSRKWKPVAKKNNHWSNWESGNL